MNFGWPLTLLLTFLLVPLLYPSGSKDTVLFKESALDYEKSKDTVLFKEIALDYEKFGPGTRKNAPVLALGHTTSSHPWHPIAERLQNAFPDADCGIDITLTDTFVLNCYEGNARTRVYGMPSMTLQEWWAKLQSGRGLPSINHTVSWAAFRKMATQKCTCKTNKWGHIQREGCTRGCFAPLIAGMSYQILYWDPKVGHLLSKLIRDWKLPFIVITSQRDMPICQNVSGTWCHRVLSHPHLVAWFAVNMITQHPKLVPIPLGLPVNNFDIIKDYSKKSSSSKLSSPLEYHFVSQWQIGKPSNLQQCQGNKQHLSICRRRDFASIITRAGFNHNPAQLSKDNYYQSISGSTFYVSPPGNGLDTYRFWEVMSLGGIPIALSSTIDPLFDDLPVILVDDYAEITREWLGDKWKEMTAKTYNYNKLYVFYWIDVVLQRIMAHK